MLDGVDYFKYGEPSPPQPLAPGARIQLSLAASS